MFEPNVKAMEIYVEQMFNKPPYFYAARGAAKKREKCKVQFRGRCLVR
ncbi:MAG: hypothetical protein ACOX2G_12150 [Bacillota bacterium]|jgi:hypothetical protein